jgi:hypothetical protein
MPAQDLTTLTQVQNWAGGTFDGGDAGTLIPQLITGVSVFVQQTFLRRRAINQQVQLTDVMDGSGGDKMVLKDWPIISVASLMVNGQPVPASPDGISAGFTFDERSIIVLPNTVLGAPISISSYVALSKFPRLRQNVTVTYTAGYGASTSPPADSTYNGAPTDLGMAVSYLVLLEYKRRNWVGQSSKSIAQGEHIVVNPEEWPHWITRVLETYRRWHYV